MTEFPPLSADQRLYLAQVVLVWLTVDGLLPTGPVSRKEFSTVGNAPPWSAAGSRVLLVGLGTAGVSVMHSAPLWTGLVLGVFAFLLTMGRWAVGWASTHLNDATQKPRGSWLIEAEVVGLALLGALLYGLAVALPQDLSPQLALPLREDQLWRLLLTLAGGAFLLNPASRIVRAFLEKGGIAPIPDATAANSDQEAPAPASFEAGRYIGYLERLGIYAFILAGSPEAIGFLLAAKGLVRGKELEKRQFTEYFLLGTLSSAAVAAVAALIIGSLIRG